MNHPIVMALGLGIGLISAVYVWYQQRNSQHAYSYGQFDTTPINQQPTSPPPRRAISTNRSQPSQRICSLCTDIIRWNLETLSCNDSFHMQCIQDWMARDNRCPDCRNIIHHNH